MKIAAGTSIGSQRHLDHPAGHDREGAAAHRPGLGLPGDLGAEPLFRPCTLMPRPCISENLPDAFIPTRVLGRVLAMP